MLLLSGFEGSKSLDLDIMILLCLWDVYVEIFRFRIEILVRDMDFWVL